MKKRKKLVIKLNDLKQGEIIKIWKNQSNCDAFALRSFIKKLQMEDLNIKSIAEKKTIFTTIAFSLKFEYFCIYD